MSAGGAFGGSRGLPPRPPEKGVFPLDHFGECTEVRWGGQIWVWGHGAARARDSASKRAPLRGACWQAKERYMACLREHEDSAKCQDLARAYLQCRMDR